MDASALINPNPVVHERASLSRRPREARAEDDGSARVRLGWRGRLQLRCHDARMSWAFATRPTQEPIDAQEVFEHIRDIQDPEHPYTLEQLDVVKEKDIAVDDAKGWVRVTFTPTVSHCSMGARLWRCA